MIRTGLVQSGAEALLMPQTGQSVPAIEVFREHFRRDKSEAVLRRFLQAQIDVRTRADVERDLQRLASRSPE